MNLSWKGYMRSMHRQLGKAGTISAFALGPRGTKKTCVKMAGRRTFQNAQNLLQGSISSYLSRSKEKSLNVPDRR